MLAIAAPVGEDDDARRRLGHREVSREPDPPGEHLDVLVSDVLAVPVAPPESLVTLRRDADEVICLETPARFFALGQFYEDFTQTSDGAVVALFERAVVRPAAAVDPPARAAPWALATWQAARAVDPVAMPSSTTTRSSTTRAPPSPMAPISSSGWKGVDSGRTAEPLKVPEAPAPALGVDEALERLNAGGEPRVFFADAMTGRGGAGQCAVSPQRRALWVDRPE